MHPVYRLLNALQYSLLPVRCVLCQNPGTAQLDLCQACVDSMPRACNPNKNQYGQIFSGFSYQAPLDELIHGFKFNEHLHYGRMLARLSLTELPCIKPMALIPVPLHKSRLRQRGFNQAQELANFWGKQLAIPILSHVLHRHRATQVQSSLKAAERLPNVAGAFMASGSIPIHVALVDDVYTTGATCASAAQALIAHGVQRVDVWCLARVV
jgi:ComF family protein